MRWLSAVNWSEINDGWIDYAISAYEGFFGNWVYPIIFLGLVGYIYCINRSAFSAAAAICILFGVYGVTGVLSQPDTLYFTLISQVIVIFSFAGLFIVLVLKRGDRS